MNYLAELCIRRPVFTTMLIALMLVLGGVGLTRLGVDRFPSVDLPSVSVRTLLPGASPEEVETVVTERIEEAVNTVEGIEELRSISGPGSSAVIATFRLDRDIDVAAQDIREKVQGALRELPDDIEPPIVSKVDSDSSPLMTLSVNGPFSIRELNELSDKILKSSLERSTGVGEVRIVGGVERTMNIWLRSERLAAYDLTASEVRNAILRENSELPGGRMTAEVREESVRTMGRAESVDEFGAMIVKQIDGVPIRIRDIGYAEDGTKEVRSVARLNGVPTVSLEIRRQSGANSVAVIAALKEQLKKIKPLLPAGVSVEILRDQSRYIETALHEIEIHLVLGSILASLMILLFVRSMRATIISALAIPTSVIATFLLMWSLDFTLNGITMLALVLMVGIVIDDAIVVIENIVRMAKEEGLAPFEAARRGTAEIALAVLATTLSLAVIFLPVAFMSSITGRFLYEFGVTAACALLVSLIVSFTLTPMLAARFLGKFEEEHEGSTALNRFMERSYGRLLRWSTGHRTLMWILLVGVACLTLPLSWGLRRDFLPPDVDEGEFQVTVTAPEGASLQSMDIATKDIEKEIQSVPGVSKVLSTVGGGFLGQVNTSNIYVGLVPHSERYPSLPARLVGPIVRLFKSDFAVARGQRVVMNEIRERLKRFDPLRMSVRSYPSFNIGGANFDIDYLIRGPDLTSLAKFADELRERAKKAGGILDADTTLKLDFPERRVQIDRERAYSMGVSAEDIGLTVRLLVGGDESVSRFRDSAANEDYDIQLRLVPEDRNAVGDLSLLRVPRQGGGTLELREVASFKPVKTAARIDRVDRQRAVSLRASVGEGFSLADRLEVLNESIREMDLPPEYSTAVLGRGREFERSSREFFWAMFLSILFMYMILASQYESFLDPVVILLSIPACVPFALITMRMTGESLNVFSALGILVLFGVVKKNAILQVDHINHLRAGGMTKSEAIFKGCADRLRPILMTTFALVAGMIPLALGSGPGAEERRAVATVVIGGQSLSLLLTLLITPVVYATLDSYRVKAMRRWHRHEPGMGKSPECETV